jgi:DNA/RNA-binding domain of Phe-tRNA-synthetase-like protein
MPRTGTRNAQTLVEKIDALSDSEATRVLNVLSEKEESMVAALRAAIQALGLKKGGRRRATRGRRGRKATRRGRR